MLLTRILDWSFLSPDLQIVFISNLLATGNKTVVLQESQMIQLKTRAELSSSVTSEFLPLQHFSDVCTFYHSQVIFLFDCYKCEALLQRLFYCDMSYTASKI